MASSTALQLDKSSWPLQILLVYRLGIASTTPETQTRNTNIASSKYHTPLNTPTTATPLQQKKAKGLVYLTSSLGMQLATLWLSWEVADLWSRTLSRLLMDSSCFTQALCCLFCYTAPHNTRPLSAIASCGYLVC